MEKSIAIPICRKGIPVTHAWVDEDDAPKLQPWRWTLIESSIGTRYAVRSVVVDGRTRQYSMHREVMGLPPVGESYEVDHLNHDGLDNRRRNLAVCTHQQNLQNKRASKGSTSRYRGVSLDRKAGTWRARVRLYQKDNNLGSYPTEEAAAKAASEWRAAHMPYSADARLGQRAGIQVGMERSTR